MTSARRFQCFAGILLFVILASMAVLSASASRGPSGTGGNEGIPPQMVPHPGAPCSTMPRTADGTAAGAAATCGYFQVGTCDESYLRDAFLVDSTSAMLTINTIVHVFCENDGSNCVVDSAVIDSQMMTTNAALAPWKVELNYSIIFHSDSQFVHYDHNKGPLFAKYFTDPDNLFNIFVVGGAGGLGDFPWQDAQWNANVVQGADDIASNWHWMTHEVGHALGLFHDWNFFSDCSFNFECYEMTDGSNGDTTGDFCSDTKPVTAEVTCEAPTGNDCLGSPYQAVVDNYMSYGGVSDYYGNLDECRDKFTAQQAGRMRCWLNSENVCWLNIEPGDVNCDPGISITDVVYLVDFVYRTGPPPCPLPNVGDFDCNTAVDAADVNILVGYVFQSGPHPECCPY